MNSFGCVEVKNSKDMTVEELRKNGYKVRVYHGRLYNVYPGVGGTLDMSLWDVAMSRRDWEAQYPMYEFSDWVDSYGGFTRVEITTPEGETKVGKFNFNNRPFNRKLGLVAAIGRAFCERK